MKIKENTGTALTLSIITLLVAIPYVLLTLWNTRPQPVISPLPDNYERPTPTPTPTIGWKGNASYYSEDGCLGCSPTLTMANGERLDDTKLTIALPPRVVREHSLLNVTVTVTNTRNNMVTKAKVTDTGGFEKYARIADISVAVKRAIRCSDLCELIITVE